jgi:hypothetical protein
VQSHATAGGEPGLDGAEKRGAAEECAGIHASDTPFDLALPGSA